MNQRKPNSGGNVLTLIITTWILEGGGEYAETEKGWKGSGPRNLTVVGVRSYQNLINQATPCQPKAAGLEGANLITRGCVKWIGRPEGVKL